MSDRFPGGVISKTPPTVVGPTDGEGGSASGVWTLDEVLGYEKAGGWPKGILPRELYAWGSNVLGNIGDNTTSNRSSPVQVGATTDWEEVTLTNAGTSAIKTNGTLWGWGAGLKIGAGDTVSRSSPIQVGALTNWDKVSGGNQHVISLKTDGTIWCWGQGYFGALGQNDTTDKSSPTQIGALSTWAYVAGGGYSSFAISTAGSLWAWGRNTYGALGLNDTAWRSSPVQVGALTNWSQLSSGAAFHTGALKTDGTLWAWGANGSGGLGQNNIFYRSSPVQVGALTNWRQVSVGTGNNNTAAIKTDGTLWGWGANNGGNIGDSSVINRSSPVQVGSLTDWNVIATGQLTAFSVKTDGTLWAWGGGSSGALGDGFVFSRSSPVQIGADTNWFKVSAHSFQTAAITKG